MNRKLLFFFLAVILTCALTACSQGNENEWEKVTSADQFEGIWEGNTAVTLNLEKFKELHPALELNKNSADVTLDYTIINTEGLTVGVVLTANMKDLVDSVKDGDALWSELKGQVESIGTGSFVQFYDVTHTVTASVPYTKAQLQQIIDNGTIFVEINKPKTKIRVTYTEDLKPLLENSLSGQEITADQVIKVVSEAVKSDSISVSPDGIIKASLIATKQ